MEKNTPDGKMIIDLVKNDARFTKFSEALIAAGLEEELSGGRNFTVFAPTNQAFAKLSQASELMKPGNQTDLKRLVSLHVFPGKLSVEDMKKATTIKTEAGREIKVEASDDLKDIKLANAKVMLPKAEARNGFIYPVDAVIQPASGAAATAT